jgi:hypothetical protein
MTPALDQVFIAAASFIALVAACLGLLAASVNGEVWPSQPRRGR